MGGVVRRFPRGLERKAERMTRAAHPSPEFSDSEKDFELV